MAKLRRNCGRMPKEIQDLERYCSSEDLSFDGIKCALGYFVQHDSLHESNFLHKVCMNRNVTLEMIEYLIELFPDMVGTKRDIDFDKRSNEGTYLLHRACANEYCPNSVVKFLMESNTDVLNYCTRSKCRRYGYYQGLPLHHYLYRHQNFDIEIVKYMVEKYPDALLLVGENIPSTPLHMLLGNENVGAMFDMVKYLVESEPRSLRRKDENIHRLPLHTACLNKIISKEIIQYLINKWPQALKEENGYGWGFRGLPLHNYVDGITGRQNIDIEIVKDMVEKYPDALLLIGENIPSTPLHILLEHKNVGAMFDIVEYLVESEPMSLRRKDVRLEQLPLHNACKNRNITKEIIQYLVNKWPEALQERNDTGCNPLLLLCENSKENSKIGVEILQVILDEYPDGALQSCSYGLLPIHYAASNDNMSVEFIENLINANPESIRQRDNNGDGDSPIHWACSQGHIDIVKYLFGLYPDLIRTIGSNNELPLHCACQNKNQEVLEYLFGLYPEAIHLRGGSGLAIHVALTYGAAGEHTKKIIEFLVLHDPDCVSKADSLGLLPLHLLCSYDLSYGAALLFDLHPEAILVRDDDGRLPVDVAREKYDKFADEEWYKELISFLGTQQNYALTARDTAAMTTPDENGLLPLHHALHKNVPLGSIKLLLKGNPDAFNVAEPDGLLPLQLACESCSLGVVKYLTGIIGECSSLCDGDDNYLLHYACRGGNVDVVRYLLEKGHLRAVSVKNRDEKLPIDLLNEFVRKNQSEEHDVKYVDIIWHLLLADPETIQNYCGNKQLA
eukprot:scaffold76682_cov82-Cyclotella_meneghiniana.AAC.3